MKDQAAGRHRKRVRTGLLAAVVAVLALSCGRRQAGLEVLARVGDRELTVRELSLLAGVSADSLNDTQRRRLVQTWVERTLIEQEGARRGLDDDPEIKAQLGSLRAELYRGRLLAETPAPAPSDSAVRNYYDQHRSEFLRAGDAYLIELFWGESSEIMARLRDRLMHGDTTLLATGEASSEGKWLAEERELDPGLERELSTLRPNEVTFPRPYEDGFRIVRLIEKYPAGTVLDQAAVEDEIRQRIVLEQSYRRQDSLLAELQRRYPVKVFLKDP